MSFASPEWWAAARFWQGAGHFIKMANSHEVNRDLELTKSELERGLQEVRHTQATDLEQLRHALTLLQSQDQTRFSLIQTRSADVVFEVYKKLIRTQRALARLISPAQFGTVDRERQFDEFAA